MSSIQQIANTISLGKEKKSKDKQKEPTTNGKKHKGLRFRVIT